MKFYSYGKKDKPTLFLLPGTGCHWKNNFGHVLEGLSQSFYVVCVSYDGFDETEKTTFNSILEEVKKIEDYILADFNGKITGMYGCSLGGSLVGQIVARKRVHISHAIIGSSDMDEAEGGATKLIAWFTVNVFYSILHKGKMPRWMDKLLRKKCGEEYAEGMKHFIGSEIKMTFVTKESLYNQYYSDLVTKLPHQIEAKGTSIHCMYATKMGEKYLKRYNEYFKKPKIYTMEGMQHEELLLCKPKCWIKAIEEIMN